MPAGAQHDESSESLRRSTETFGRRSNETGHDNWRGTWVFSAFLGSGLLCHLAWGQVDGSAAALGFTNDAMVSMRDESC